MKKIFMILALMAVTMTAGAWNLKVVNTLETKATQFYIKYASLCFEVDGTTTLTADEGKTVTIKVIPDAGYGVKTIAAQAYTSGTTGRASSVDMLDSIPLTRVRNNIYTFTMPRASVKLSLTMEIQVYTPAEEGDGKAVNKVKVKMAPVEGSEPKTEGGFTYIPVAVTGVDFSDVESSDEQKDISLELSTQMVGTNVFVVKKIQKGAFEPSAGAKMVVSRVFINEEEQVEIEEGAMKTNARGLLYVQTPLALLDDYALTPVLKENFQDSKVSAVATAPNRYWTFSSGVDTKVPDGIKVFGVYNINGVARILEIKEANEARLIKANNGVLMDCTSREGGAKYEFIANPGAQESGSTIATTDANSYEGNSMMPVIENYHFDAADILILKDNEFHTIGSQETKVPACKAVLSLSKFNK